MKIAPRNSATWNNLGVSLRNAGRNQEAIEAYRKSIEIEPLDGDTWLNLCNALFTDENYSEAFSAADRAAQLDPEHREFLGLLIKARPNHARRWIYENRTFRVVQVTNNDTLSVRSGPGVRRSEVGRLPPDAEGVTVTGGEVLIGSDTWVKIEWESTKGYVNLKYLELE